MKDAEGPKNFWGEPNDRPMEIEGSCGEKSFYALVLSGSVGTFYGAINAAWYPDPITSADGVVGRTDLKALGRTVFRPAAYCAVVGTTFAATECLAESARGEKDAVNAFLGGAAAGMVMMAHSKRFDVMAAGALGTAIAAAAVAYTGPSVTTDEAALARKVYGTLPKKHVESAEMRTLKENYPKWKGL